MESHQALPNEKVKVWRVTKPCPDNNWRLGGSPKLVWLIIGGLVSYQSLPGQKADPWRATKAWQSKSWRRGESPSLVGIKSENLVTNYVQKHKHCTSKICKYYRNLN